MPPQRPYRHQGSLEDLAKKLLTVEQAVRHLTVERLAERRQGEVLGWLRTIERRA
jgi:hypothetical protein